MSRTKTTKKATAKGPRKRVPPSRRGLDLSKASAGARKTASALLQVLAGTMTPAEAAAALGVSHPMVYKLEARALEGFVQGCEPKSKGAPQSVETQLKKLQLEHAKLQRECARLQALVRAVQRATGIKPPPAASKAKTKGNGKPRRKRKPAVRAMRLADKVKGNEPSIESAPKPEPS